MKENLDVFGFELANEQMAQIAAMDTGQSLFVDHRDPSFVEFIGAVRFGSETSRA
jgi:2,5-diketo-D-gluconate reductase A